MTRQAVTAREIRKAVRHFWDTRKAQAQQQAASGTRDRGSRGAVTGGAQMDGFIQLIEDVIQRSGTQGLHVVRNSKVILPGYFRPTKEWNLLVVVNAELAAVIEVKSQVGSFGNNFNNRVEEAIGSAQDFWVAFREGAFGSSPEPWLGYVLLLEESDKSMSPVRVLEPHFDVFPEFRGCSYARRHEIAGRKLVRERLYRSFALVMSQEKHAASGKYTEPAADLKFTRFAQSLVSHLGVFS